MNSSTLGAVMCGACRHPRLSTLTVRQMSILLACDVLPWRVATLAEHLGVGRPIVSRGADELVEAALLRKWKDKDDKRQVWLQATDEGKAALAFIYAGGAELKLSDLRDGLVG